VGRALKIIEIIRWKEPMKLNIRKVIGVLVLGLFLALASLWNQFPKHSRAIDFFWVVAFTAGFLAVMLGIDQSIYRDNKTLRKID
jgi:hypothetical protein